MIWLFLAPDLFVKPDSPTRVCRRSYCPYRITARQIYVVRLSYLYLTARIRYSSRCGMKLLFVTVIVLASLVQSASTQSPASGPNRDQSVKSKQVKENQKAKV